MPRITLNITEKELLSVAKLHNSFRYRRAQIWIMMSIRQLLASSFHKPYSSTACNFERIIGHDGLKLILSKAILSRKPVHILFVGQPGSAKTMFLTEMMQALKQSYFIVGSNTTKAGLINQLFERRPKYLLVDELEKMNKVDQMSLLHLMETGIISETKMRKTRQMKLTSWVFATANNSEKLIEPILSRFLVLPIPEYTFSEFTKIAIEMLSYEKIDMYVAMTIAEKVWNELGSKDIRNVIKIARLTKSADDISSIIQVMKRN